MANLEIKFQYTKKQDLFKNDYVSCVLDIPYVIPEVSFHNLRVSSNKPFFGYKYKCIMLENTYKRIKIRNNRTLFGNTVTSQDGFFYCERSSNKVFEQYPFYNGLIVDLSEHKKNLLKVLNKWVDLPEWYERRHGEKLNLDPDSEYETETKKLEKYLEYKYSEKTGLFIDFHALELYNKPIKAILDPYLCDDLIHLILNLV